MKLGSISAIMALAVLGAALWCGGAIAQTSVCTPDSFGRLICRERKQTPDPIDGMIAAMGSNCLSKSDRLTEALAAFGQPVRGGTSEALANAARVTRARQERCAAEEAVARRAAQARELARAELQMLRDQEAAANAAVAEANRRAAAQQAAQEQQRQAQLQREGQGRQDLMTVVSTAVLEGRCDDAKAVALQAGNLDLAEQAMRLCKPKPAAKAPPGRGATGKVVPPSPAAPPAKRAEIVRPPAAVPARPTSPAVVANVSADWLRRPTPDEMGRYFPPAATAADQAGKVSLSCRITVLGRADMCSVVSETPEGYGFGAAAIRMASEIFEFTPALRGGYQSRAMSGFL